jgi:phospholipase C
MGGADWEHREYSRRTVLGAAATAGLAVAATRRASWSLAPPGLATGVGVRPRPHLPEGRDTLPEIDHIIVLMMENHSFDNYLGTLGRGDGLKVDRHGRPVATNPDTNRQPVRAFRMPSTCQLPRSPSQAWNATHIAMDGQRNDGFVRASGPVAMGYWTPQDIPFYAGLARTFPLADRWFASTPAQTYANRRFLLAATANGMVTNILPRADEPLPPNGTITQRLDAHGIPWKNYYSSLPTVALWPSLLQGAGDKVAKIDQFFTDAAAGTLPGFAIVDPEFSQQSEENPQDIRQGEAFASRVINAVMHGPAWPKTLLVWCYDEHGGYYDHVPPPRAVAPDDVPPAIHVPPDQPGGYDRYGFRVPAVVVSPRAKRNHVSHVTYDHTSILRLVETKWNLPALTRRDAHAANLLDCIDLHGRPAFLTPPRLPAPSLSTNPGACAPISAAMIPPA